MKVSFWTGEGSVKYDYELEVVPRRTELVNLNLEDAEWSLYGVREVWWTYDEQGLHSVDVYLERLA